MSDEIQLLLEIRDAWDTFNTSRQELIRFLHEVANKLDGHNKNVKITKVATGSTGIVETVMGLTGLLFDLPTGGISMALTIGGGALAATSRVAHIGSSAVKSSLTQWYQAKWDVFSKRDETNRTKLVEHLEKFIENLFVDNISYKTKIDFVRRASSLADLGCSGVRVAQVVLPAARLVRVVSVASEVLGER
jgi:hypothetical protein